MSLIAELVKSTRKLFQELGIEDGELLPLLADANAALNNFEALVLDRDMAILSALVQAEAALEAARTNGPEWMGSGFRDAHGEVKRVLHLMQNDRKS